MWKRRSVYLPDGSDTPWSRPNRKILRAKLYWREAEYATPLREVSPWYPYRGRVLWSPLIRGAVTERVVLAPSWLVSMENGIGHKHKHVQYGANPPVTALVHYTCIKQSENARIWPMRLLGGWHAEYVAEESANSSLLSSYALEKPKVRLTQRLPDDVGRSSGLDASRGSADRLIAFADATLDYPLPHPGVDLLNARHALIGGLASMLGRS